MEFSPYICKQLQANAIYYIQADYKSKAFPLYHTPNVSVSSIKKCIKKCVEYHSLLVDVEYL